MSMRLRSLSSFCSRKRGEYDTDRTPLAQFAGGPRCRVVRTRDGCPEIPGKPASDAFPFREDAVPPRSVHALALGEEFGRFFRSPFCGSEEAEDRESDGEPIDLPVLLREHVARAKGSLCLAESTPEHGRDAFRVKALNQCEALAAGFGVFCDGLRGCLHRWIASTQSVDPGQFVAGEQHAGAIARLGEERLRL
jgi:hypothetical protein